MSALVSVSTAPVDTVVLHTAFVALGAFLAGKAAWWWLHYLFDRIEWRIANPRTAEGAAVDMASADATREIPAEDEPSWPGKAPHIPVEQSPTVVLTAAPERAPEMSHPRHAKAPEVLTGAATGAMDDVAKEMTSDA